MSGRPIKRTLRDRELCTKAATFSLTNPGFGLQHACRMPTRRHGKRRRSSIWMPES